MKKYIKAILYLIIPILFISFILSIFEYFNIYNKYIFKYIKLIILIISCILSSYYLTCKNIKKLSCILLSLFIIIFLFLINILFIKVNNSHILIYYLIIICSYYLGCIIKKSN